MTVTGTTGIKEVVRYLKSVGMRDYYVFLSTDTRLLFELGLGLVLALGLGSVVKWVRRVRSKSRQKRAGTKGLHCFPLNGYYKGYRQLTFTSLSLWLRREELLAFGPTSTRPMVWTRPMICCSAWSSESKKLSGGTKGETSAVSATVMSSCQPTRDNH